MFCTSASLQEKPWNVFLNSFSSPGNDLLLLAPCSSLLPPTGCHIHNNWQESFRNLLLLLKLIFSWLFHIKVSYSIGCTLGKYEVCRTSYPMWLSAKQYTIGESFSLQLGQFVSKKSLRILVRPFPLSTGHPPSHQRLHVQVMRIIFNEKQVHHRDIGNIIVHTWPHGMIWTKGKKI